MSKKKRKEDDVVVRALQTCNEDFVKKCNDEAWAELLKLANDTKVFDKEDKYVMPGPSEVQIIEDKPVDYVLEGEESKNILPTTEELRAKHPGLYESMIQPISVSADFNRTELNELGRKAPYTRYVLPPLEGAGGYDSSGNYIPIHPGAGSGWCYDVGLSNIEPTQEERNELLIKNDQLAEQWRKDSHMPDVEVKLDDIIKDYPKTGWEIQNDGAQMLIDNPELLRVADDGQPYVMFPNETEPTEDVTMVGPIPPAFTDKDHLIHVPNDHRPIVMFPHEEHSVPGEAVEFPLDFLAPTTGNFGPYEPPKSAMWHQANSPGGTPVKLPPPASLVTMKAVEEKPVSNRAGVTLAKGVAGPQGQRQSCTYEARPGRGVKNV